MTDVRTRALEDEPARLKAATARGKGAEVEADDDTPRRQALHIDPIADVPHEQDQGEIVGVELRGAPPLAPLAQPFENVAELLGRPRRAILESPAPSQRLAPHDAGVPQLSQPLREERPRDQRQSPPDLAEPARAEEQFPQDQGRPALGKGLAGHRDGAELSVALHDGGCRQPALAWQVHFLGLARAPPEGQSEHGQTDAG